MAVISYTGYDMEDAMILNKASYERGLAHGCVYKTIFLEGEKLRMLNLHSNQQDQEMVSSYQRLTEEVGNDGLPSIGKKMEEGDVEAAMVDTNKKNLKLFKYKDSESSRIDNVRAMSVQNGKKMEDKVVMTIRQSRNPIIGDKFSSRHG